MEDEIDSEYRIVEEMHPLLEAWFALLGFLFICFVLLVWTAPIWLRMK